MMCFVSMEPLVGFEEAPVRCFQAVVEYALFLPDTEACHSQFYAK